MLTKEEFKNLVSGGAVILDGATGSNLRNSGMPKGCCTEKWVLENPAVLQDLQRRYAESGSQILYAPTFQAQPLALKAAGLEKDTEKVNADLIAISRAAAPNCLIAGDIATMAGVCDSWDEGNFDLLVENYRRQIHGLIDGGADLLVGETLMYGIEAEAILTAAELEGAGAIMFSFTMQPDGSLFSGAEAGPILKSLEDGGADAVGFNCVAADMMTPHLVSKLKRYTKLPLICKPNAGIPVIGADGIAHYNMKQDEFAGIVKQCFDNGACILGGCCGTTPEYIREVVKAVR